MAADPYLDVQTGILINKQGIRDPEQLRQFEYAAALAKAPIALAYARGARKLNEVVWRGIHKRLFGDVYAWAGKYRITELAKGNDNFAPRRAINGYADSQILPAFHDAAVAAGCDRDAFVRCLAVCLAELMHVHPFREGNGRATHLFVTALTNRYGGDIDWAAVGRGDEIAAAIAGNRQDYSLYETMLGRALMSWDGNNQETRDFWPSRD